MRKAFLILLAAMLFLVSCAPQPVACTPEAKICPDGTAVGRTLPNCDFAPCPEKPAEPPVEKAIIPEVIVADTDIVGNAITIAKITAAEPGWIAIHSDDNGKPGAVAGYSHVGKGESTSVKVDLNPKTITPILYAMLHVDRGKAGVYEFPGDDVPATADGKVVNVGFAVEVPETVGTKEFTILADDTEFSPEKITVSKGDKVKITFNFNDGKIYYGGLDIKSDYFTVNYAKSEPNSKTVEFTTENSFTFTSYWPSSGVRKADGRVEVS
ncbi:hypothetical protein HY638_05045 [Candidatus Woesearchaeota archaeon]|nr:hypothetical protein [Candidatus Woesearchaeota archaeon]